MNVTDYHAPKWLKGGHLQTIWSSKCINTPAPQYRRTYLPTPDQSTTLACDYIDSSRADAPLVVLFHGLEGSSHSHYAKALMNHVAAANLNGVVVHFRGCGNNINLGRRAYHSGDTDEARWVLAHLKKTYAKIYAAGVSLGGNMLAKYMGEAREDALCEAAAVISAPLDLVAASDALSKGFAKRVYIPYFLNTLKSNAKIQWSAHPDLFELNSVLQVKTLSAFDNLVTAPMHGFKNAMDYWTQSSAKPYLQYIQKPTLVLNAQNDPFLPASALPTANMVSNSVTLLQPQEGGHVGFASGPFPGNVNWLPQTILKFFRLA
ncbi:MAG: alpha/beta fold hydrolase [Neisseriaceae bacterium]|nr:alpha/beta fold hydrolase [Neisseriaceae bacterium]MBP6862892.1 alpha/beta fold hydrolase [Neisseriaceae bacterium]